MDRVLCSAISLLLASAMTSAHASYGDDDASRAFQTFSHMSISMSDGIPEDGIAPFVTTGLPEIADYVAGFDFLAGTTNFYAEVGAGTQIDISFDLETTVILDQRYLSLIDIEAGGWCDLSGGFCDSGRFNWFGGRYVVNSDTTREGVLTKTWNQHFDFRIFNWHDETRTLHLQQGGGGRFSPAWPPYTPPVPEPDTGVLMLIGAALVALRPKWRMRAKSCMAAKPSKAMCDPAVGHPH